MMRHAHGLLPIRRFLSLTGDRRDEIDAPKWSGTPATAEIRRWHEEDGFILDTTGGGVDPGEGRSGSVPPIVEILRHALLPVSWEAGARVHWGVASGGGTNPIRARVQSVTSTRWTWVELLPGQLGWNVLNSGVNDGGMETGTTIDLQVEPGLIAAEYGLFCIQLILLEIGAVAEQIAVLAAASGFEVNVRSGGQRLPSATIAQVFVADGGGLAELPVRGAAWQSQDEWPVRGPVGEALAELAGSDEETVIRLAAGAHGDLFAAARRRTSGPTAHPQAVHPAPDIGAILSLAAEIGKSDPRLALVDRHAHAASAGLNAVPGPGAAVGPGSVIIAVRSEDLGSWTTFRSVMMAAGAAMQRVCLAAATLGCWARPLRQVPDRLLNAPLELAMTAVLQIDMGRMHATMTYDL